MALIVDPTVIQFSQMKVHILADKTTLWYGDIYIHVTFTAIVPVAYPGR